MKDRHGGEIECASLQHHNKAIALFASTVIIFTPSIFAFSFSNWFLSDKANQPTQVVQANSANPAVETPSVVSKTQTQADTQSSSTRTTPPKLKHKKQYKKYCHHHANAHKQPVQSTIAPVVSTSAPLANNEITLSGGLTISALSNSSQAVALNNIVTNTYNANSATNVNGMAGLTYGRLFHLKHDIVITIGPSLYYTNIDQVNGTEHPFSNAGNFDTLNYHYSVDSWSLMAESKLVYEKYQWQPFITGGIGPSWNYLSSYGEVPTDPSGSAAANPSVFKNNTQAEFAYDVGFGVQRIFYANAKHNVSYRTSLVYRYFNFGSGQLSPASISTTGQAIKVSTLDTNAILLGVSAVF